MLKVAPSGPRSFLFEFYPTLDKLLSAVTIKSPSSGIWLGSSCHSLCCLVSSHGSQHSHPLGTQEPFRIPAHHTRAESDMGTLPLGLSLPKYSSTSPQLYTCAVLIYRPFKDSLRSSSKKWDKVSSATSTPYNLFRISIIPCHHFTF